MFLLTEGCQDVVFVFKSPPRERLETALGSQRHSTVASWLVKTFYWPEPVSEWSSLVDTSQKLWLLYQSEPRSGDSLVVETVS